MSSFLMHQNDFCEYFAMALVGSLVTARTAAAASTVATTSWASTSATSARSLA